LTKWAPSPISSLTFQTAISQLRHARVLLRNDTDLGTGGNRSPRLATTREVAGAITTRFTGLGFARWSAVVSP
jgi:hypothetical protein